jgi:hypothetical protein
MRSGVRIHRWHLVALLAAAGCGDGEPTPRAVEHDRIVAGNVAEQVLAECHAPLRGRMGEVTATVTLPDGVVWQVFAVLPDRARLQAQSQQRWLVRDAAVVQWPAGAAADVAEEQFARDLCRLVDAIAFGPLHRAVACRAADGAFVLEQAQGEEIALALRERTLLPQFLRWPDGHAVELCDYLHTGTTWIPQVARSERLGRCRVRLEQSAVGLSADLFRLPSETPSEDELASVPGRTIRMPAPGSVVESRSPVPILVESEAVWLHCVADPGSWAERARIYAPLHAALEAQKQWIAGFPALFDRDGQRWLAAPFRARKGGPEFAAPPGAILQTLAAGRWLVVYPPRGDVAARIADGEAMLRAALTRYHLAARGPLMAQPYFHLEETVPAVAELAAPTVRVAIAVE